MDEIYRKGAQLIMKIFSLTPKMGLKIWMISFIASFSLTGCFFLRAVSINEYIMWGILLIICTCIIRKLIYVILNRIEGGVLFRSTDDLLKDGETKKKEVALRCTLIIAAITSVYWIAFYPGNMFVDTYYQFTQIYDRFPPGDWHCYGHTLFMKIIIQCTADPAMIVWIQIITLLYIMYQILQELYSTGFKDKFIYIFSILFSASLSYGLQITNIWKDTLFSIAQLYTVYFLYKNYESKFINMNRMVTGIIGISGMMLFRHNGIWISIVILITIILISGWKYRPIIFTGVILSGFLLFTYWLFPLIGVESNAKVTSYLPLLHGIAAVEKEFGSDGLDIETRQFMDQLLPENVWVEKYDPYNGDSYLFDVDGVLTQKCENYKLTDILMPYLKTLMRHPFIIIKDRLASCELSWNLIPVHESYNHIIGADIRNSTFDNDVRLTEEFNILSSKPNKITALIQCVFNFVYNNTLLNIVHFRPAWLLWILILILAVSMEDHMMSVILTFPVIINIGTLLLAMNFQAYRYVWGVFLCTPNIILLMAGRYYWKNRNK